MKGSVSHEVMLLQ